MTCDALDKVIGTQSDYCIRNSDCTAIFCRDEARHVDIIFSPCAQPLSVHVTANLDNGNFMFNETVSSTTTWIIDFPQPETLLTVVMQQTNTGVIFGVSSYN